MKPSLLILAVFVLSGLSLRLSQSLTINRQLQAQIKDSQDNPLLKMLGTNNNDQISESSGLGASSYVDDAFWTINDSGHPSDLFLLKTSGKLLGRAQLRNSNNVDWEAMAQFEIAGTSYLLVADVGDNSSRRKSCQLYLLREPDFDFDSKRNLNEAERPALKVVDATKLEFTYPQGPRDCEAIAVDSREKQIWLAEKVFYNAPRSKVPGLFVLPLSLSPTTQPAVARRVADFPIRGVTGMAFSADGKRLIIRNYLNAHLYSRNDNESWQDVVKTTKPLAVALPFQRQGEAICFTPDSKSILLTSEFKRQPIWQLNLQPQFDIADGKQLAPAKDASKPDDN